MTSGFFDALAACGVNAQLGVTSWQQRGDKSCLSIPRTQRTDVCSRGDRPCQASLKERTRKGARKQNRLESRSWKALSTHFSQTRDCTTFTLQDFYIESVTAHRIKINDHSCFHNSWPNSKTKLITTTD